MTEKDASDAIIQIGFIGREEKEIYGVKIKKIGELPFSFSSVFHQQFSFSSISAPRDGE